MKRIRLVIIEDNKLLREGIRIMIKEQKDIRVVADLGDKIKVQDKIRVLKPDVLLMDLGLAHQSSLKLVKSLKKKFPILKIIVMDLLPIQSDITQYIEEGVSGFIFKNSTTEDFINTIKSVAKGDKISHPKLQDSLLSEVVDKAVNELMGSDIMESIRMTGNEKNISKLIAAGLNEKEIAEKLDLSSSVVKGHTDNILEKLSLGEHVQIAVYRNSGVDYINSSEATQMKAKKLKKKKKDRFSKKKTFLQKIK